MEEWLATGRAGIERSKVKISQEQFEQIRALVIEETGAIVSFYEKKKFGKSEGYTTFEEPIRIFVCRSSDTVCYTRATIVLLHEYGHVVDYIKHKTSSRIKKIILNGIPNYDPTRRSYKDATVLSKKEKVLVLKTEWYANEYAKKFAVRYNFDFLNEQLNIEQVTDYRYAHYELVQGVPTNRPQRRQWTRELRKKTQFISLKDVNELTYV